jgi:hypothetical protein
LTSCASTSTSVHETGLLGLKKIWLFERFGLKNKARDSCNIPANPLISDK